MSAPLLSYAEAAEQVQLYLEAMARETTTVPVEGAEALPLAAAAGRVLAEPIYADRDQPPFPRSTRDGYACRAAEANTHELLFVAQQIRAGQAAARPLALGETCEIMTGAPVPEGADAVFMVEHAEQESGQKSGQESGFVRLTAPRTLTPGENIVPQGSEALRGELLLAAGTRLGPAQIALAAQCGYARLKVARRPRVVILTTGDEVVPVEALPEPSQIRNSNAPMLAALVEAAGAEPVLFTAADNIVVLDAVLQEALSRSLAADLLLVSGGISAGRFDLVADALTRRGARFFFAGVAIQPGKPVAFGQAPAEGRPIPFLALPGNPISSAVTFYLFAAPLLAALGDDTGPRPYFALARLTEAWHGKPGLTRFLPAACNFGPDPAVHVIPWQGSGDLAAFARSNCFLVTAPETGELPAGTIVQILLT
jgi:molybdopterin molybdotransferase